MSDSEMFLANNVLAQIGEIRRMNREPRALRLDPDSFDCLIDEIAPFLTAHDVNPEQEMRIYGLRIEICAEPNFEVV